MSVQCGCVIMQHDSAKPLILLWILSVITVIALIICAVSHTSKYASASPYITNFHLERLSNLHKASVVVMGTSFVLFGLPYDAAMEKESAKKGMPIQFVRFSFLSGMPEDFLPLLKPILLAKPKWVFIQIGPFITDNSTDITLRTISMDAHQLLGQVILGRKPPARPALMNFEQSDLELPLNINTVAKTVGYAGNTKFLRTPSLSRPYQQFLKTAAQEDIHVVFLQINCAMEAQAIRGPASAQAEAHAIAILTAKYHLEVWQSPAYPLKDYIDGCHLNTQGRALFTQWFLQRLKNEFMDH